MFGRPPMTKLNTRDRDADLVIFVCNKGLLIIKQSFFIDENSLCYMKEKGAVANNRFKKNRLEQQPLLFIAKAMV